MIKAEVVEYPGAEVPNWVSRCRDILTSPPALAGVTLVAIAIIGTFVWHSRQAAFTNATGVQSIPSPSSSLQVITSNNLPVPTARTLTPEGMQQEPVGPAPADSRDSLQPTGLVNNGAPGLTQADQAVQNAGRASLRAAGNLGL
jgi:hypothetical protein